MSEIFISYRREDASGHANSIYAHLAGRVGASEVFLDTGGMEAGSRWLEETKAQIESCEVCLVIIGRHWNTARLRNRDDVVRLELETALNRKLGLIPVLVDGADLPAANDLPTPLEELPSWQAVWLNHRSYEGYQHDLDTLAKKARALLVQRGRYGIIQVTPMGYEPFNLQNWLRGIAPKRLLYVSADEQINSNNLVGELSMKEKTFCIAVPVGICSVQASIDYPSLITGSPTGPQFTDVKTFMIRAGDRRYFFFEWEWKRKWLEETDVDYADLRKRTEGREVQLHSLDDFPHR